jgi:hypothetical protein
MLKLTRECIYKHVLIHAASFTVTLAERGIIHGHFGRAGQQQLSINATHKPGTTSKQHKLPKRQVYSTFCSLQITTK